MRIVCDRHIPFLVETVRQGWPQVEVIPLEPSAITREAVRQADVLVVRTRTAVNEDLLSGSNVQLVCTATIGYDHIDTAWCDAHQIAWTNCPGCNAQAVCDYIEEAIDGLPGGLVMGIVGVGHVGSKVAAMAERKGMQVLLNDPPKQLGVPLMQIAHQADIITFHTPLDETTYHLCDKAFLQATKPQALIINAARGGVVDEQALIASHRPYILDTWEGEPHINEQVLQHARLASMHIAGYSVEGKKNATEHCLCKISQLFGLPILSIDKILVSLQAELGDHVPGWLKRVSETLKQHPQDFEQLRKQYKLR